KQQSQKQLCLRFDGCCHFYQAPFFGDGSFHRYNAGTTGFIAKEKKKLQSFFQWRLRWRQKAPM
ncbi:MAG: hypothetical protein RRZ93_08805, partial [Ruthenibacterium sp.]